MLADWWAFYMPLLEVHLIGTVHSASVFEGSMFLMQQAHVIFLMLQAQFVWLSVMSSKQMEICQEVHALIDGLLDLS